jgi:signal transduction histidine kinase
MPNEHFSLVAPAVLAARGDRLLRLTAAIADAVTSDQVFEALVDQVAAAMGAASGALWLVRDGGAAAHLARACGYDEAARRRYARIQLDETGATIPISDAIRRGTPIWLGSQDEMLSRYPRMADAALQGRHFRISCLPVVTQGQVIGGLAFTFDLDDSWGNDDERIVLALVIRHASQALERLRLFEAEQASRARAEAEAARTAILYGLARSVIGAGGTAQVFEAALDAIGRALSTGRAAVLVLDDDGVLRVGASRGFSDDQRRALEGWSPWGRDVRDPAPVLVPDAATDPQLARHAGDGAVAAYAFLPLVAAGRLLGELVVCYGEPRELAPAELELGRAISDHVAAAVSRFSVLGELQEAIRVNELFTGILGHDLRNPLAAIITSARLAASRDEGDRLVRPLSRILRSGERMARLIDQLLDFTRVRLRSGMPLNRRLLHLQPLVRQVMDELDDSHPAWTMRLDERGDCRGFWDADRLSQVFSNLVANALEHGQPDGGVQVVLDGTSLDHVRVDVRNRGAIPPDVLPHLFEPLAGRSRRPPGSRGLGLGLYITNEIVKAHGGEIQARSDEPNDTTFSLVLPREARAEDGP